MDLQLLLFVGFAVVLQMSGQVCLKRGINALPKEPPIHHMRDLMAFVGDVVSSRLVRLAVMLLLSWFLLYLAVISRFPLSQTIPLNSLDLLLVLIVARFYLRERIPAARWVGAIIICAGIFLVAAS